MSEYFLPAIITDDADSIIQGNIEISENQRLSMLRLFFQDGTFSALDHSAARFGKYAVIIVCPSEFSRRLNEAVLHARPYLCSLNYLPTADDVGFVVKRHPRLSGALNFPCPVYVQMDDISIVASTEDLIQGKFPDGLVITDQFDSVRDYPRGLVAAVKSVVGDFTFVEAKQEWIDQFHQNVLHPETWKPAVIMDQVVQGGALSPCLSFWHTNGLDHVEIRRNKLSVCMQSNGMYPLSYIAMNQLFAMMLQYLNSQKEQKYTHLSAEYVVDFGMIEPEYQRLNNIKQSFDFQGREKFCAASLRKDYGRGMNVFGIDTYEKDWIFNLKLESRRDIHIGFMDIGTALVFMSQSDVEADQIIDKLVKHEDKYNAFNRFRTESIQQYI